MLKCYRCKKNIDNNRAAAVYFNLTDLSVEDFEIVHTACRNPGRIAYSRLEEWLSYWDLIGYLFLFMDLAKYGKRLDLGRLARVVEDLVNEISRLERLENKKPKVPRDLKEEKERIKAVKAIFGNTGTKFKLRGIK